MIADGFILTLFCFCFGSHIGFIIPAVVGVGAIAQNVDRELQDLTQEIEQARTTDRREAD